jgi:hypothetical protein
MVVDHDHQRVQSRQRLRRKGLARQRRRGCNRRPPCCGDRPSSAERRNHDLTRDALTTDFAHAMTSVAQHDEAAATDTRSTVTLRDAAPAMPGPET